jgi:hypothetical protein
MKVALKAFGVACSFALLLSLGCATAVQRPEQPTMAVAINSPISPPSAEELVSINRVLVAQIAQRGFRAAQDVRSADYLMRVRFTPDTINPPGGHLEFLDIEKNAANGRGAENAAAEASTRALADLSRAISEIEWAAARSN